MAASVTGIAWRALWRDLRAGELRLLMVAVALAVGALSAVGFFADRLERGLERDARQLLGGDAVLVSDTPPPPAFAEQALKLGLRSAMTLGFPTMGRAPDTLGGTARLVALKAVQPGYPLRGSLKLNGAAGAVEPAAGVPAPGMAWVDPALLQTLQLEVGQPLLLGRSRLLIERVIAAEPDRGAGFAGFAPRVMINAQDLEATGLVQPASRITWRLAVAGEDAPVAQFVRYVEDALKNPELRGLRLESLQSGRPEMRQTLERAEKFLNLVALLTALLCAVALALAGRAFANAHLDDCAMRRVLGLSQRDIVLSHALEFSFAALAASLLGAALGFAAHHLFVLLLGSLVDATLPAASWQPLLLSLGVGLTLLAAFGLPPVLQLARVPPLRVIRRDLGALKPASLAVLALGIMGFVALLLVLSADIKLALIAVGGFAAALMVFAGLAWGAVKALARVVNETRAPRWLVLATRQVAARPAHTVVQTSALATGLLALVLLVLLRTDLIASWRRASPPDAPNRFVLNVQPEQSEVFQKTLRDAGVAQFDWFPMIRGRLVGINDQVVSPELYNDERARRLLDREFNLSHSAQAPAHNTVVAGRWTPNETGAISVEEGIAKTLQLKLGDRLVFDVGGQRNEARITSLRKVDWGSMRANFFVMYPLAQLDGVPATYMGAFRAPATPGFDNALVRNFPNITNVDMTAALAQVQTVLNQVIRAIEFLFSFTLAAGLVVLFATVSATREQRAREFAILRALGARSRLLAQVQRAELAGTGLLAGALAGLVASAIGWALARYVFEFAWNAPLWVSVAGALAGATLALAAGWWSLREVLRRPVVQTLRQAAE